MIPNIDIQNGGEIQNALIAILAVLVADGRVTVSGNWYRLDQIKDMAAKIKPNPLDGARLWDNS